MALVRRPATVDRAIGCPDDVRSDSRLISCMACFSGLLAAFGFGLLLVSATAH